MIMKRVDDSKTEQAYVLLPKHINGYGRLFGGMLMQWIDEMAGIVSRRHCGMEITTAAIDHLTFKHAAYKNQTIVLIGKVTYVGRTSMEIRVDTYVEALDGTRRLINTAYVVMVAIDEQGKAQEVPGLRLETEMGRIEWESGKRRYELRRLRHQEGF